MQAQILITIAQKSTNEAQSEGVGCGGAFNQGLASSLQVALGGAIPSPSRLPDCQATAKGKGGQL